jgi:hypothetical protein
LTTHRNHTPYCYTGAMADDRHAGDATTSTAQVVVDVAAPSSSPTSIAPSASATVHAAQSEHSAVPSTASVEPPHLPAASASSTSAESSHPSTADAHHVSVDGASPSALPSTHSADVTEPVARFGDICHRFFFHKVRRCGVAVVGGSVDRLTMGCAWWSRMLPRNRSSWRCR